MFSFIPEGEMILLLQIFGNILQLGIFFFFKKRKENYFSGIILVVIDICFGK